MNNSAKLLFHGNKKKYVYNGKERQGMPEMSEYKSPLFDKPEEPDYLVCTCMGVMHSEIVQAIKDGHTSFDALSDLLMVGTGCTSCIDLVEEILEQELKK